MYRFDFHKTKVKTRKLGVRVKEGRVGGTQANENV